MKSHCNGMIDSSCGAASAKVFSVHMTRELLDIDDRLPIKVLDFAASHVEVVLRLPPPPAACPRTAAFWERNKPCAFRILFVIFQIRYFDEIASSTSLSVRLFFDNPCVRNIQIWPAFYTHSVPWKHIRHPCIPKLTKYTYKRLFQT